MNSKRLPNKVMSKISGEARVIEVIVNMDQELPMLTLGLISVSGFIKTKGLYLLMLGLLALLLINRALKNLKIQILYLDYRLYPIQMKIFGKKNVTLFYLMGGCLLVLCMNLKNLVM